jgi:phosphoglycerate dehydrogenase-like enzyme
MTRILILLTLPQQVSQQYFERVKALNAQNQVNLVDHHSKVDPYIEQAEVLITFGPMMAEHVLQKAKNLKWIQALGTGVDGITNRPSLGPGVTVTNLHGIHGPPVSEAALSMMFALSRGLWTVYENQRLHRWEKKIPPTLLHGKTVVIYGTGVIAAELAPKCKALGMRVIGISSTVREIEGFDEVHARQDALQAIPKADYLVLLTPYTAQTHGIINKDTFSAMKPSAYLINLARGGVVNEDDLIQALESQTIQAAALDVFDVEPLPSEHPFWQMNNVIVTAHSGGFYDGYVNEAIPVIETNLNAFEQQKPSSMINVVKVAQ